MKDVSESNFVCTLPSKDVSVEIQVDHSFSKVGLKSDGEESESVNIGWHGKGQLQFGDLSIVISRWSSLSLRSRLLLRLKQGDFWRFYEVFHRDRFFTATRIWLILVVVGVVVKGLTEPGLESIAPVLYLLSVPLLVYALAGRGIPRAEPLVLSLVGIELVVVWWLLAIRPSAYQHYSVLGYAYILLLLFLSFQIWRNWRALASSSDHLVLIEHPEESVS